jgi:hypothetical protein
MPQIYLLREGMRLRFPPQTYVSDKGYVNAGFRKATAQYDDQLLHLPPDLVFRVAEVRLTCPGYYRQELVILRVDKAPDPRALEKRVELSIWQLDRMEVEDADTQPAVPHRILEEYDLEDEG